ncbi:MAG: alpha/beta hydrolase [Victivallales bacterium]|jgi:acetyl esterase/lipase|nr:alpha/beta hydrolase [Victivallales bacterium]
MKSGRNEPLPLWPDGAPGAKGTDSEDCPDLTVHLPAGEGPFPCVVVCPGGGYGGRAAHEADPIAEWLAAIGIAGAVVSYRVSPYRHPIPIGDAQRAIRMVRANAGDWGIDASRVGILGFSAGGHLATSAATIYDLGDADAADPIDRESCRPDALVSCYPVISLGTFQHQGSVCNLLADADGKVDAEVRNYLSLEDRVTPDTPPTFLWHTANDPVVPVENALLFASACARHGVPFALHVFPDGRHGLGLGQDHETVGQWPSLCARWFADIGFRE